MQAFFIRFFISNLYIAAFIGSLLLAKRLLRNHLSCQTQYHICFFVFAALAVPFLPVRSDSLSRLFSLLVTSLSDTPAQDMGNGAALNTGTQAGDAAGVFHDFTESVSSNVPSGLGACLFLLWSAGVLVALILLLKARIALFHLEHSACLLQNQEIRRLFKDCKKELKIKRNLTIYTTAFLKSPVTLGIVRPRIYLPLHLVSDFNASDMRYMLLHELQHYRHGDAWIGHLMNLAGVVYWFNPAVLLCLKRMGDDRELYCDASVLRHLDASEYNSYGNTLLLFAEKLSASAYPFVSGIGGNFRQIRQRIIHIAAYRPTTRGKRMAGIFIYILLAVILAGAAPVFSAYAAPEEHYRSAPKHKQILYPDLSAYFDGYEGSFVFYDTAADTWSIYNQEQAAKRVSPDSTYKIYSALIGLESGAISADNSDLSWNGTLYPFAEWNQDQNLTTAMHNSVNWYFQNLDRKTGEQAIQGYLDQIGYGNGDMSAGLESCWLESSLKISPLEQVELLQKLLAGKSGFKEQHVRTVKDTLLVQSGPSGRLYGKTGTGAVDGMEVNGWFVGFAESADNTYIFALNIQGASGANGTQAKDMAMRILQDM